LLLVTRLAQQPWAVPRGQRWRLAVAGLLNVAGFNICAVFAQLSMPSSRAAILTFTMPLWSALFAWLVLGERLDRLRLASLAVGLTGLAVISEPFWQVARAGGIPFGLVYVLGAAIFWAAGTVFLKAYPVTTPPLTTTAWQVVAGAALCLAGLATFETPRIDLSLPSTQVGLAYHVLLPQAASYVLWFTLIRQIPASTAAVGTLLIPIFGVLGAVVMLGDRPTALDLAGLGLILSAVALDQVFRPWLTRLSGAAAR
jgi:drug/metabolite transporter (DMT)-like permease